jgi:Skp family chaperone for outer membrane proteins
MITLVDKIAEFKARQKKIMELHAEFVAKSDAFGAECESRMEAIKTEYEVKKAELAAEFEKEKAFYKADLKAQFGITDGDQANILDVVELILRVKDLA